MKFSFTSSALSATLLSSNNHVLILTKAQVFRHDKTETDGAVILTPSEIEETKIGLVWEKKLNRLCQQIQGKSDLRKELGVRGHLVSTGEECTHHGVSFGSSKLKKADMDVGILHCFDPKH
jgi:hypothetical protein